MPGPDSIQSVWIVLERLSLPFEILAFFLFRFHFFFQSKANTIERSQSCARVECTEKAMSKKRKHTSALEQEAEDARNWLFRKARLANLVAFVQQNDPTYTRNTNTRKQRARSEILLVVRNAIHLWTAMDLIHFVTTCKEQNRLLDESYELERLRLQEEKRLATLRWAQKNLDRYHHRGRELKCQLEVLLDFDEIVLLSSLGSSFMTMWSRLRRAQNNESSTSPLWPDFLMMARNNLGLEKLSPQDQETVPDYLNECLEHINKSKHGPPRFVLVNDAKCERNGESFSMKANVWTCEFQPIVSPSMDWCLDKSHFLSWEIHHECKFDASVAWNVLREMPEFDFMVFKIVVEYIYADRKEDQMT